ncbi:MULTISPECIES: hypothetical protein [unclassified Streptomyces]|uniref:hypothetical protein n=1 Tax=unclassified Streptomyces TaxID=2593676 RepID=UPI00324E8E6B
MITTPNGEGFHLAAEDGGWRSPLHESVLEGDYGKLERERTTFYGFRCAVWNWQVRQWS